MSYLRDSIRKAVRDHDMDVYAPLAKILLARQSQLHIIALSPRYHVGLTNNQWYNAIWTEILKINEEMNSASSWVQERRLRPIYELLDGGNNRKVITEVDRLLKKQPAFPCAMVLKALALIRMNKPDEARSLLAPVAMRIPTDDATIQAMSICYRELEAPELLAGLLEAACEKEKSEELLTHCFMAHVRIQDYKKMHVSALQLYKLYNKITYYGWTVASIFLRFENLVGPMEHADVVSIEVAGRMMEKYMSEQKTSVEDNMLELYLRILVRQANWQKIVDVMTSSGYPQQNWSDTDFHTFYCLALERLGLQNELFEYLKSAYFKNKEEYALLKQLIDTFGVRKLDVIKLESLMDDLVANYPNRAVLLADLYYSMNCFSGDSRTERISRDLLLVVEYAVDKPSFFSDVIDYFKVMSYDVKYCFVNSVAPGVETDGPNFDTIAKIVRDTNFEMIFRSFIAYRDDELSRIRQANICFGKYLICDGVMDSLHSNEHLRTKESDYHDQYLVIAALNLLDDFFKNSIHKTMDLDSSLSSQTWVQISEEEAAPELLSLKKMLLENQQIQVNSSNVDGLTEAFGELQITEYSQAHFADKEALMGFAICILEYGLLRSPYNYTMRILLSKVYARFGAVSQAIKVMQGLDLKHVQWDSLGYLIIPQSLTSGTYTEVMKMLTAAETMYSSYKRESMEHVIAAYKYGSFHKIQDFLNFRKQLLYSTQCGITLVEKRLLELMTCIGTSQELLKIAECCDKEMIDWLVGPQFDSDNRDFSVIQCFDNFINLSYVRDITADLELFTHRLRLALLFILKSFIVYPRGTTEEEVKVLNSLIVRFECHRDLWLRFFQNHIDEDGKQMETNPGLYGIWPHRQCRYYHSGAPLYLVEQFKHLRDIIMAKENPQVGRLQALIEDHTEKMLNILRPNQKELENVKRVIIVENHIQDFHIVLETFSFTRIVLEAAVSLTKRQQDFWKAKGKARERSGYLHLYKKSVSNAVRAILEKYKELHQCFNVYIDILKERPIPRLDQMKTSTRDLWNNSFLSAAFPITYDIAQRNIRDSHLSQLEEMRKISAGLVEYIRSNLEPYGK